MSPLVGGISVSGWHVRVQLRIPLDEPPSASSDARMLRGWQPTGGLPSKDRFRLERGPVLDQHSQTPRLRGKPTTACCLTSVSRVPEPSGEAGLLCLATRCLSNIAFCSGLLQSISETGSHD
jgi:hypothetical protein